MIKYLLPLLVASSFTVAEEVSVYGGNNLNANNPYGLNSSEKHILKNQANISNLSSQVGEINSLVKSINSRLEGLESTYEGDSAKLNSLSKKVSELSQNMGEPSNLASNNMQGSSGGTSDAQLAETVNSLKAALTKLTTLVNKINSEYVSDNEFEKNMQQFITREEFEALKKSLGVKTAQVTPTKTNDSKSSNMDTNVEKAPVIDTSDKPKLLSDAKKDFDSKKYDTAFPKFEKLAEINYKSAENNFYLGQIWYIRKKYDLAISHYKKSAIQNDKAAYMPTLLLHSAISFEKIKDNANAKSFYNTLVDLYPDSSEAGTAKKNLSKLK